MASDDRAESVVPLSRWRAVLARSRNPRKRAELLVEDAHAAALVPVIPVEELYYLVRGVGLEDAGDVLSLASGEQLQGCLDLDLWERDRLSAARVFRWLEVLAELPPLVLARAVRAFDEELVALMLGRHVRIHDHTLGEAPEEESPFVLYRTPDAAFVLELRTPTATAARTLERFVACLYDADPDLARTLLTEAKWGTTAELEEESYRWRTARLADLGFPAYEDALAVYREIDPARVAPPVPSAHGPDETPVLPVPFAEALADDTLLGRALARIDDETRLAELAAALLGLLNAVLVADRVDPAELDQVRETAARVRDTLSLALDHLAGGDVARAAAALERGSLPELFRVGYSLTTALARRARALDEAGVIDPSLDTLLEPRPLFPGSLDPEPVVIERPFRSVADVRAVEAFLDGLERGSPAG